MKHGDYCRYNKRNNNDEHYVIDLCDDVLGEKAIRHKCFDFLRGDASKTYPLGKKLPVDAYYKTKKIVVEYHECQHTESVAFFNRSNTVSGVSRDEQRKIYDERRKIVLPKNGIDLIILSYTDFKHDSRKRLLRDKNADLETVRQKLTKCR